MLINFKTFFDNPMDELYSLSYKGDANKLGRGAKSVQAKANPTRDPKITNETDSNKPRRLEDHCTLLLNPI